jgi:GNAT superfamily N-acetyltransferase
MNGFRHSKQHAIETPFQGPAILGCTPLWSRCRRGWQQQITVASDLVSRPDLTPWLASVFVDPPYRGRGYAARLVRRVEEAARAANTGILWLYTEDAEGLYAKLGWKTVGAELDQTVPVTLMQRRLN